MTTKKIQASKLGYPMDFDFHMDMPRRIVTPAVFGYRSHESFYKRYELVIWLLIAAFGITGLYLLFRNNANLLFQLSTPVMEYVP